MEERRSKAEIYLHLVWCTRERAPFLTPEWERRVHRCVAAEARRLECVVLEVNGMPDHVHLVVEAPTRVSAAELMRQVKGVSSHFIDGQLPEGEGFRWQEGYGVFSVSRSHLKRVIAYVRDQKRRHAAGTIWPEWEETDAERPPPPQPGSFAPGPEDRQPQALSRGL